MVWQLGVAVGGVGAAVLKAGTELLLPPFTVVPSLMLPATLLPCSLVAALLELSLLPASDTEPPDSELLLL